MTTEWYRLRVTAPPRPLVFGDHAIARCLGKEGLPDWAIGETWEVSDVDGSRSTVIEGPLAGMTLRELVSRDPEGLMGPGWSGDFFPVRAGETIYVPGGTLHSFGPDTLIYEIEQTSDVQQHAMRWNMQDGSRFPMRTGTPT